MNSNQKISKLIFSIFISLALFFSTQFILRELLGVMLMQFLNDSNEASILYIFDISGKLITLIISLPIFIFTIKKFNPKLKFNFYPKHTLSFKELVCYFIMAFGFSSIFLVIPYLLTGNVQSTTISNNSYFLLSDVIFTILLFPLMEEIIFRNYIYTLLTNYNIKYALIISALLFSIGHGSIINMVTSFIPGIFLAILFAKSQGILYGYIIHSMSNLILGLILPLILASNSSTMFTFSLGICLISFVTALFIAFFKRKILILN